MEKIILAIRLGLRRAWRGLLEFLDRSKLSNMPPVRTVAICLAVGLIVPLAMGIDKTPASLSRSLADERLKRFAGTEFPDVSPTDTTYSSQPGFFWKGNPNAKRYRFRLLDSNGVVIHATSTTQTHYLLPAPGELAPGDYVFKVESLKEDGASLGQRANQSFSVRAPDKALGDIERRAMKELDTADAVYVMAGLYADRGYRHDARSALARYVSLRSNEKKTARARSVLGR